VGGLGVVGSGAGEGRERSTWSGRWYGKGWGSSVGGSVDDRLVCSCALSIRSSCPKSTGGDSGIERPLLTLGTTRAAGAGRLLLGLSGNTVWLLRASGAGAGGELESVKLMHVSTCDSLASSLPSPMCARMVKQTGHCPSAADVHARTGDVSISGAGGWG